MIMETYIEQCKEVRKLTMAPMKDISKALAETNGDVSAAVQWLIKNRLASAEDMANRKADNNVVHSYVHNHKVGAMIVLACQTDFVAKNDLFLQLAKDICMHICSAPRTAEYLDESEIDGFNLNAVRHDFEKVIVGKPPQIVEKIVKGKMDKWITEVCLLNQPFVRDENTTIKQLIANVSGTVGEKIQIRQFVRFSA